MYARAHFKAEYNKHKRKENRLTQLIANLEVLRFAGNNQNIWSAFTSANRHRLHLLNLNVKRNPAKYNLATLRRKQADASMMAKGLLWAFGYLPKSRNNWIGGFSHGGRIPPGMPLNEAANFLSGARRRLTGETLFSALTPQASFGKWRKKINGTGLLKPVIYGPRKRPSPPRPPAGVGHYVPESLQEIAWSQPRFKTIRNLPNNKFNEISQNLKPELVNHYKRLRARYRYRNKNDPTKVRRYPQLANFALQHYRRQAAARAIQYAGKKWIQRRRANSS